MSALEFLSFYCSRYWEKDRRNSATKTMNFAAVNYSMYVVFLVVISILFDDCKSLIYSTVNRFSFHQYPNRMNFKMNFCTRLYRKAAVTAVGILLPSTFIIGDTGVSYASTINDPVAVKRFNDALQSLQALDKNWDSIVKGQGDNIRRQLGTVYTPPKCESPLCSFPTFVNKFVQSHEDLDVISFEDPIAEVLEAVNQVSRLIYFHFFQSIVLLSMET